MRNLNNGCIELIQEIRSIYRTIEKTENSFEKLLLETKELNPRLLALGVIIVRDFNTGVNKRKN